MTVELRFNARVLTISELARRSGLTTSTLRFYERKKLLFPVRRAGRVRIYDDAAIDRVAMVNLLQYAGFTLAEIAGLAGTGSAPDEVWRAAARAKLTELDKVQDAIERARTILEHTLACPHVSAAACPVFQREVRVHARRMERGELARLHPPSVGARPVR